MFDTAFEVSDIWRRLRRKVPMLNEDIEKSRSTGCRTTAHIRRCPSHFVLEQIFYIFFSLYRGSLIRGFAYTPTGGRRYNF